jgi:subtilase family serine protease
VVTQPIDRNQRVILPGNTRPEATAANDRGIVSDSLPMEHMQLLLRLPPEKQQALDELTRDQVDAKSPSFHRWLTPEEFKQQFSLAPEDIQAITTWLQSEGFAINGSIPSSIDFSGNAANVRSAFHTETHRFDVNGAAHIANMSDPQIPSAIAPVIVGVVALHDFRPRAALRPRPAYTTATGLYLVAPGDLATIYDLNPLFAAGYSGQGQTIAVIESSDLYSTADWNTFRDTLGLTVAYPTGSMAQVHPSGSGANNCADPGTNGADVEATLDAEWASAAAPSATIEVASCADSTTTPGIFIALENLVNEAAPPAIVSISYISSEAQIGAAGNAFINTLYQQAASEGISIFAGTGDSGAAASDLRATSATHGIGVNGLASTPYNVAVGGTDFVLGNPPGVWSGTNSPNYGSARSYAPEIPWDDSCANNQLATYFLDEYYPNNLTLLNSGPLGFCNTAIGEQYFLTTSAGSGGASSCATGVPATSGVVGGSCAGYPKPSWQSLTGNPNDGVRDIPDVSLFAGTGTWGHYYVFCWSDPAYSSKGSAPCTGTPDTWSGGGGTSFAAPIMAGIQALVNQKTEELQGNPANIYYRMAAVSYANCQFDPTQATCAFHDIQTGDIDVNCTGTDNCFYGTPSAGPNGVLSLSSSSYQPAFTANTGWDFATGIGSVDAYKLAFNWPTSITATSGTPQSTTILSAFAAPFTVVVKDPEGNPISNLTVTFTAPLTGASGTFAGGVNTAVTNQSGIATSTTFTANSVAGSYTVQATSPSITGNANFSLTNTPGSPATITAVTFPQSALVNDSFAALAALVQDVGGNALNGVKVIFTPPASGASLSFAGGVNTATTTSSGYALSPPPTANGTPGVYTVLASVAGLAQTARFLLSNTATAPAALTAVSGTPQSTPIFSAFGAPFVARVTDASGNPVSGAIVQFYATGSPFGAFPNGLYQDAELVDANGIATSKIFSASGVAGSYSVAAFAAVYDYVGGGFGTGTLFNLTNIAGPPAQIILGNGPFTSPLSTLLGIAFPSVPIVYVRDAGGNGLAGVPVTFSAPATGPSATCGGKSTCTIVTGADGSAICPVLMPNSSPGSYNLVASVPGITALRFSLTNVDYSLAMHTPGTVQITPGTPATVTLDMATIPANTPMPGDAFLSCLLPTTFMEPYCSFNSPGGLQGLYQGYTKAAITLTIFTSGVASSFISPLPAGKPGAVPPLPEWTYLSVLISVAALGLLTATKERVRFRKIQVSAMLALLVIAATGLLSCGGSSSTPASMPVSSATSPNSPALPTPPGPSTVTITATVPTLSGNVSKTLTIDINVN